MNVAAVNERQALQARLLDDDPLLLEQSYRLRYQVYCVERRFLSATDYPDRLEFDAFDRDSIHVGAVDRHGALAATGRIVMPNPAGLPLFRYCTLFPSERTLNAAPNLVVEVSRVSISRSYVRERRRSAEPLLTLLKALIHAARCVGATHMIGANETSLYRRLVRFGFPYRVAGPPADYYGPVAPYVMSLAEFDQVILGGHYPALDGFLGGLDPKPWPVSDEYDRHVEWSRVEDAELSVSRVDS